MEEEVFQVSANPEPPCVPDPHFDWPPVASTNSYTIVPLVLILEGIIGGNIRRNRRERAIELSLLRRRRRVIFDL